MIRPRYDGPVTAAPATRALQCGVDVAKMCRARCLEALQTLVAESEPTSPLRALMAAEQQAVPPPGALETSAGFTESMLRLYVRHGRVLSPSRVPSSTCNRSIDTANVQR